MLSNLYIKNLALVEELNIEFSSGLNVVTGETGAGKSIILGAIKLLLGERADKSLIRTDAKAAELSAILELGNSDDLKALSEEILNKAGIIPDEDGQIILRRVITPSSSKNFINSTPTTLQTMKELGSCFIDIYAPGEQQGLADNSKQRTLLDRYAGLKKETGKVKESYQKLAQLLDEKDAFHNEVPDRGELDILRYQLNEIIDANLQENEDVTVQQEHKQCSGARELMDNSQAVINLLNGDSNSILNSLQLAFRQLQEMSSIDKEGTAGFTSRVENLTEEIFEISRDIDNYTSHLNLNPEHLDFLEERLQIFQLLKRKFGPELHDVFTYQHKLEDKISKADGFEDLFNELLNKINKTQESFDKSCNSLSHNRKKVTKGLSKNISEQLNDLGFNGSQFSVEMSPLKAGPSGHDHIEFCFAPNSGEGSKPIKDIGSSGEISRVMLAVKTVLAKIDKVPVLIFDEIDANIGGVVATQVSKKLIELGKHHQIFCITHMPQVAAGGKTHYRVEKNVKNGRTTTEMILLENEDRVDEISRMLGGTEISTVVKTHAQELLRH